MIEVFDPSAFFPASFELYNLREDLGETKNLADANLERVAAMRKLFEQHYRDTNAVLLIPNPGFEGIKSAK